ncbi:hypothetical protein PG987_010085 [Apiospora arundinis]
MPSSSRTGGSSSSSQTAKPTKRDARQLTTKAVVYHFNGIGTAAPITTPITTYTTYETGVDDDQPEFKYLQASDVRRQVQQAPKEMKSAGIYPRYYGNKPYQPLSSPAPHREFPIAPSPQPGEAPRNWQPGRKPGPVRAFYNEQDRSQFDVGYHDPSRPPTGPQNGAAEVKRPYSLATYHPGPANANANTGNSKKQKPSK